ncbi:MAG: aspartate aminotransferase [Flavobacteriales bacterium]|jgi:aspartate aminotransferase
MEKELSSRIQNLSESQTIAMSKKARELNEAGKNVISLSLGEPDFNTPDFIKDAAIEAIHSNFSKYTAVPGYKGLIDAIITKFKRDNNLNYAANEIVASTGAKQSIVNAMMSLLNPGDEVIVPTPYWVSYVEMIKLAEGTPVFVEGSIEQDFKITPTQLENSITPKSKIFIFSSPCNPSGSVYSESELEGLVTVFEKHPHIIVISDEIYEHINFEGHHCSIATLGNMKERTVTVNGVSKAFAMTGWRLGYIGAPEWIASACTKMQGQVTSGTCSITQKAASAALLANPDVTHHMRDTFKNRRDFVFNALNNIPNVKCNKPGGAFYLFPDISGFFGKRFNGNEIKTATDLSLFLLEEALVATVTGEAFGADNCLRISYAASNQELETAMHSITKALGQLA